MSTQTILYWDGQYLNAAHAVAGAGNSALLFGESVFTTIRCYAGRPFCLSAHLARLQSTLDSSILPFTFSITQAEIEVAISRLLRENQMDDAIVRLTICGEHNRGVLMMNCRPVTVTESQQRDGVGVFVSTIRRDGDGVLGRYKTGSYLENRLARREAERAGMLEGLLTTTDGHALEGAYTNLFLVKDGTVITPPLSKNILPGIARNLVLCCCRENKIQVQERPVALCEVADANELFLTNCHVEILPVNCVKQADATVTKMVGPVTRHLQTLYTQAVQGK